MDDLCLAVAVDIAGQPADGARALAGIGRRPGLDQAAAAVTAVVDQAEASAIAPALDDAVAGAGEVAAQPTDGARAFAHIVGRPFRRQAAGDVLHRAVWTAFNLLEVVDIDIDEVEGIDQLFVLTPHAVKGGPGRWCDLVFGEIGADDHPMVCLRGVEGLAAVGRQVVKLDLGGADADIAMPRRFIDVLAGRLIVGVRVARRIDDRVRAGKLQVGQLADPDGEGVARQINAVQLPGAGLAVHAQGNVFPVAIVPSGRVHLDILVEDGRDIDVELAGAVEAVEEPELQVDHVVVQPLDHANLGAGARHVAGLQRVVDAQPVAEVRVARLGILLGLGDRGNQGFPGIDRDGVERRHAERVVVVFAGHQAAVE